MNKREMAERDTRKRVIDTVMFRLCTKLTKGTEVDVHGCDLCEWWFKVFIKSESPCNRAWKTTQDDDHWLHLFNNHLANFHNTEQCDKIAIRMILEKAADYADSKAASHSESKTVSAVQGT